MNDADYVKNIVKNMTPKRRSEHYAYKMGVDCAKNGATLKNCHFSIFSSPENTKAWEKGVKEGKDE